MRNITAFAAALLVLSAAGVTAYAQEKDTESGYFRNDGDSVYFFNPEPGVSTLEIAVSGLQPAEITAQDGGYVFDPKADGYYLVTIVQHCEEIVNCAGETHFHYFYNNFRAYQVTVENGAVTVGGGGGYSGRSTSQIVEEQQKALELYEANPAQETACYDVYGKGFGDPVPNESHWGCAEADFKEEPAFLTQHCTEYGNVESWFCLLLDKRDSRVGKLAPETDAAQWELTQAEPDWLYGNALFYLKPLADGTLPVTVGKEQYLVTVEDGAVQGFTSRKTPCPGDTNGDWRVDVLDVFRLQRWLKGYRDDFSDVDTENTDINGDGEIDIFDLALMKRQAYKYELTNAAGNWTQLQFYMDGGESRKVFTAGDTALIIFAVPAVEMHEDTNTFIDENGDILVGSESWWEPMEHFEAATSAENCEIVKSGTEAFDGIGYYSCLVRMTGAGTTEIACRSERETVTVTLTADENGNLTAASLSEPAEK